MLRQRNRPLSLAVHDHLVRWQRLAWPIAWSETFGRQAPLAVEIGFGNGEFLLEEARSHPERDHVGIELSWASARRLLRRLDHELVTNTRVVLADAQAALELLFEPASIDCAWLNNPCPWPKGRHAARRLGQRGFFELLASRLRPGAPLRFVTDHAQYADWLAPELAEVAELELRRRRIDVADADLTRATKYQKKALARGTPLHVFEGRRIEAQQSAAPPRPAKAHVESSMMSLTLRGRLDPGALELLAGGQCLREQHDGVDVTVRLGPVYRQLGDETWLVEALVLEDKLSQSFAILVIVTRDGRVLVKHGELGECYPTHGVRLALWEVGRLLREHSPGLELAHENLGRGSD